MKIRFLHTRTVQAADGETFEAGKTYELTEASAQRWIARGLAVDVTADEEAAAAAAKLKADEDAAAAAAKLKADEEAAAATPKAKPGKKTDAGA